MYEINKAVVFYRREVNQQAFSVASLAQLTYNMNRGTESSPLESLAAFLPFPKQHMIDEQMPKIEGVSEQAARDFLSVRHKLKILLQQQVKEWGHALEHRANGS